MVDPQDDPDDSETGPPLDTLDSEAIRRLIEGMQRVVEHQGTLLSIGDQLRTKHLNGDNVQNAVGNLLREIDEDGEVMNLVHLLDRVDVEELFAVLDDSEAVDLDDERKQEFQDVWQRIDWMAPAAEGYSRYMVEGTEYWTDIQFGLPDTTDSDRFLMGEQARHGLDELWSVQAPMIAFIERNVHELATIAGVLDKHGSPNALTEQEINQIVRLAPQLQELADAIAEEADKLQTLNDASSDDFDVDDLLE